MRLRERLVRRQVPYRGVLLTVRRDTVRLPDGSKGIREIVAHPGAVAVVPVDARGEVTLVRQWRHALGRETLEIPAGKLDGGESPAACARRELAEETGLSARRLTRLATLATTPGFTDERIHLFLATGLSKTAARPDADEFLSSERMPLARAVRMVRQGRFVDAKSVAGLLLAAARRPRWS